MGLYSIDTLKKLIHDPKRVTEAPRIIYRDAQSKVLRIDGMWYKIRQGFGDFDPMEEDWDNLIILDGARPDYLANVMGRERIDTVTSPASYSGGFMQRVFNGRRFHDTIYVTANPHVDRDVGDDVFHAIVNVLDDGWNKEMKTVLPETVVRRTVEAHKRYPDKRLIAHFMQPHFPFLGPTGTEIDAGFCTHLGADESVHPWYNQMWGDSVERATLLKAYLENHDVAYNHAKVLDRQVNGTTVVTADHANLIGERGFPIPIRLYGHPDDFPHPALLEVPWLKWSGRDRDVCSEKPRSRQRLEQEDVDSRLESLGYK